jgi:hypothetical protein
MTTSLRDALASAPEPDGTTAKIYRVYADGTVDLNLGGGRIFGPVHVVDTYTPHTGQLVATLTYPNGQKFVLGAVRTANATTQRETVACAFPFNVLPGTSSVANPYVIPAGASGSWRSADGWAWLSDGTVAQGANSTAYGYYRGCWFYGDAAFDALAGRTVTRIALTVARKSAGGVAGAQLHTVALHAHGTRPGGEPTFVTGGFDTAPLAWGASGEFDLPVDRGQSLVNRTARGVGLLRMASGNGNYSLCQPAGVSDSGRLRIWWA